VKKVILLALISLLSCHTIGRDGIDLIKEFEGCYLEAYQDIVGVWTIGYGTTDADRSITGTNIYPGLTITQSQADEWLRVSINRKYGPNVDKFDNVYHWTQNEFDALCSFAYNIGSIDELVSNGSLPKASIPSVMLQYVHAGGQIVKGLVRRRQAEVQLFKKGGGNYDDPTTPSTPSGSRRWLPQVTGYDQNDSNNGYAGVFGRAITGLRVSGGKKYRVHIKGGKWLSAVTGNNENDSSNGFAGDSQGSAIDAVAISGNVNYAVHIKGGRWLPTVNGYNVKDSDNGYAGIIGREIDAITIEGRKYASAYNE
jgi:GH24 family phage-related lysozyme (muramidase)